MDTTHIECTCVCKLSFIQKALSFYLQSVCVCICLTSSLRTAELEPMYSILIRAHYVSRIICVCLCVWNSDQKNTNNRNAPRDKRHMQLLAEREPPFGQWFAKQTQKPKKPKCAEPSGMCIENNESHTPFVTTKS